MVCVVGNAISDVLWGNKMTDKQGCALVLEGGGYRGIFTSGVLDVLQERGVYGFSGVWGTSAGALNAACFKSRQIGRSARVVIGFCDDSRMMSVGTLVSAVTPLIDPASIQGPTLVIGGDKDPYLNLDSMRAAMSKLPSGSKLEIMPGAAHAMMMEKPYYKEFRQKVVEFLEH